jgi:hypothetical protein
MLDANDRATVFALRELVGIARQRRKPMVVWVGAGASSWSGYLLWKELAEQYHTQFAHLEPTYDSQSGRDLLSASQYPELFQLCRATNVQRFNSLLVDRFSLHPPSGVYRRLLRALSQLPQRSIVTTNIDELLEKGLHDTTVVGRQDTQRALELHQAGASFVYKLHGTVGDVASTVFTTDDYNRLVADAGVLTLLERMLSVSCVLFVGYSVQDAYVLDLLSRNAIINRMFGDGPHFAILTQPSKALPTSVRVVKYIPRPHLDHRTAISVVEEVGSAILRPTDGSMERPGDATPAALQSAHFLFEVYPPGTWETSQTLGLSSGQELVIGAGFTNDELPRHESRAMHDLLVGLVAFDVVHVALNAVGRIHDLLGSGHFWQLIERGVFRFVHLARREGVLYAHPGALAGGMVGSYSFGDRKDTRVKVAEIVRQQLKARPGFEREVERRFDELESMVVGMSEAEEEDVQSIVRGLLLRPSIRRLIGMSEGTPVDSIPRWAMYPVLRLAQVAKTGCACRVLKMCSAKLDFGMAELAGPAFATAMGVEWVDAAAGYVLGGNFSADLGALALEDPAILDAIVAFRESGGGVALRREVYGRLQASEGAEVSVAVNGGLRAAVPAGALQKARDEFVRLYMPGKPGSVMAPAIWNDRRYAEAALASWRRRSRSMLDEFVRKAGLRPYAECPCSSGEQLKFCCMEALGASA